VSEYISATSTLAKERAAVVSIGGYDPRPV
jgi:hypothetical protein